MSMSLFQQIDIYNTYLNTYKLLDFKTFYLFIRKNASEYNESTACFFFFLVSVSIKIILLYCDEIFVQQRI